MRNLQTLENKMPLTMAYQIYFELTEYGNRAYQNVWEEVKYFLVENL